MTREKKKNVNYKHKEQENNLFFSYTKRNKLINNENNSKAINKTPTKI